MKGEERGFQKTSSVAVINVERHVIYIQIVKMLIVTFYFCSVKNANRII
jgi:hypothetical protein